MGNLLTYVLLLIVLIILFKFNLTLGIIVTALVILYGIYTYIPTYYASKGNQAFNNGDFKEAAAQYKKCMQHRPKVNHRINYAYMLMRIGEFDEAEKVLDFILRFRTVKPQLRNEARRQRCMVYYKQNRLDEAVADAQTMFDDGYKTSQMYAMLGYFKLLQAPTAQDTYDFCAEAYDYDEDNRDIKDNMILAFFYRGEYEKAKEISDKVMSENPQFVEAYYHGAQIEEKLGNYDKALEYIEKIPTCRWSNMTTVTEEQVDILKKQVESERGKK